MKKISSFLLVAAICAAAATTTRVSRNVLKAVEVSLDERIKGLWPVNPFSLIGNNTRGLYLDGYGAVFTVDVSPVLSLTSLMHPSVTKEEVVKAHKERIERIAQLKHPVPADDQITMVVYLAYHQWEDISGTPAQLTFQGKKKALLEARRAGGAALTQAVQVTEN